MEWNLVNPLGLSRSNADIVQRVYSARNARLAVLLRERGIVVERDGGRLAPLVVRGWPDWSALFEQTIALTVPFFDHALIVVDRSGEPAATDLGVEGTVRALEAAVAPRWTKWKLHACGESDVSVFGRFYSGEMTSVSVAVDKLVLDRFVVREAGCLGEAVPRPHHLP
ncbi:MAG: hypothetical protein H6723_02620 [Sandaracinus sp.]|nr:hypothetical protein [Sandaracinus sp.]